MKWIASFLFAFAWIANGQDPHPLRPGEKPAPVDDVEPAKAPPAKKPAAAAPAAPKVDKPNPPKEQAPAEETKSPAEPKPADDPNVPAYVIQSGDSLSKVASQVYGNGGYHLILKHFNQVDPKKLKIGQVIKTPDLMWLLEKEKVVPLMADAVTEMMEGRKTFIELEPTLRKIAKEKRPAKGGKFELEEAVKTPLLEAQKKVLGAMQKFGAMREGMKTVPESTSLQLRTVAGLMGELAAGKSAKFSNNIDMTHHHLGNALVYAVIWAQNGYK